MRLIFENARMKKLYEPKAKERKKQGGDKKSNGAKSVRANLPEAVSRPRDEAAVALNVSPRTVENASTVIAALKHPNGAKKSDRQIAEHVGVDHKTVSRYRSQLAPTGEIPQSPERTGRDGRTINTANIGKRVEVEARNGAHGSQNSEVDYSRACKA